MNAISKRALKERDKHIEDNVDEVEKTPETPSDSSELQDLLFQIKKEKYKLSDERTQVNALIRRIAREDTIKEIAADFAERMNSKFILENTSPKQTISNANQIATLLISDWHYGIEIHNHFNQFDTEIAKQRIQKLQDEVITLLKKEKIERLNILNLGDLIAGRIHLQLRLNSRIDVIDQVMQVAELLAEFIYNISRHVNWIDYYSTLDNHSRLEPNIKDAMDLESLVRIIDWFLIPRLQNCNVTIHMNEFADDIITFKIFDHKVAAVHGHKDKPNKIIDGLTTFTKNHVDLVCAAHYHHFSAEEKNDTVLISNSSLMGTDDYATDLRLSAKPSQVLIISTKDNPVYNVYRIIL